MKKQDNNLFKPLKELLTIKENELKEIIYKFDLNYFIEQIIYSEEEKQKGWRLGKLHQEWQGLLKHKRLRILAPRGHLKTSFFSIGYLIQRLKFNPDDEIYIFSKTDTQAVKILDKIKQLINKRDFLKDLTREGSEFWNKTQIRCSNGATVYAQGLMSAIRGGHPKLIILDDPIDTQVIYSEEQNKKTIERYYSEILPMAEPNTQIIIIGTLQKENDLYGSLDKNIWKLKTYDAIVDEEKKIALFPEKWSWEILEERRREICSQFGEKFWLKEYRNIAVNILGEIIKKEWLCFYEKEPEGLRIFQAWDLSVGKDVEKGDFSSCITLGANEKGDIYVLDVFRERIDFPTRLKKIQEFAKKWKPEQIGIENNVFQYDTVQTLIKNTNLPIKGIKTTQNKIEKFNIELAPRFENKKIFLKAEQTEFINELLSLPRGTYDDQCDACCLCLSLMPQIFSDRYVLWI
jgi:predicted phage terminase large subunit-like protein